jgi:hypothetical protein
MCAAKLSPKYIEEKGLIVANISSENLSIGVLLKVEV